MKTIALALSLVVLSGCGTYRITYRMPSKQPEVAFTGTARGEVPAPPVRTRHRHGIGLPFLLGGGAFFFLFSQLSPAVVDYTGTRHVADVCPAGISELTHYHTFGQNSGAAFASWLLIANWLHNSNELWTCASPEEPGDATAPESASATTGA